MKRGHKAPTIRNDDTGQKMRIFIKDFFNKCDQIRRKLRIWSRLLKKSSMKNFFVQCEVSTTQRPLIPTSDLPKKRSKPNPKSTKQISILEEKFLICNQLNSKFLESLINHMGLKKALEDSFPRKRQKLSGDINIHNTRLFLQATLFLTPPQCCFTFS